MKQKQHYVMYKTGDGRGDEPFF